MKCSLGRRPLEVKFAFILAVTLLLPGVTSKFIVSITTTSPDVTGNVTSGPKAGDLEEEPALDKFNEVETTDLEESPLVNNETRRNDERNEDDALALFSLLVKRAVDEELVDASEGDESGPNSVDEDKFSISDLPKLLKPLIDAFSSDSSSEAPSKDDFLSWFPSLKDLFEPNKLRSTETTNSATRSGRRSSFSAASEPSLQTPPTSTQPPEPENLPSSHPGAFIASVPTITRPPITITKPRVPISKRPVTITPPEDSDSDEDSEIDF